jgi:hypothetical protein
MIWINLVLLAATVLAQQARDEIREPGHQQKEKAGL